MTLFKSLKVFPRAAAVRLQEYLFETVLVGYYYTRAVGSAANVQANANGIVPPPPQADEAAGAGGGSLAKQSLPTKLQLLFDAHFLQMLLASSSLNNGSNNKSMLYLKSIEDVVFSDPVDRILYAKPLAAAVQDLLPTIDVALGLSSVYGLKIADDTNTITNRSASANNSGVKRPDADPPLLTHAMKFPTLPVPPPSSWHAAPQMHQAQSMGMQSAQSLPQAQGLGGAGEHEYYLIFECMAIE